MRRRDGVCATVCLSHAVHPGRRQYDYVNPVVCVPKYTYVSIVPPSPSRTCLGTSA